MNSSVTSVRKICSFLIGIGLTLSMASPAYSLDKKLNFNLHDQTMAEVAKLISQQLGYNVLMDNELATTVVSGNIIDTTLEDFLTRRAFRKKNIVILFDDKQRTITIKSLERGKQQTENERGNQQTENEYVSINDTIEQADEMDLEVTEGVLRRDVIPNEDNIDPMDLEVTEGVVRRDVLPHSSDEDPLDLEVTEGVKRRDVIPNENNVDPMDLEVTEGVKRRDVSAPSTVVDPMDLDVTEGIKRRSLLVRQQ